MEKIHSHFALYIIDSSPPVNIYMHRSRRQLSEDDREAIEDALSIAARAIEDE